MEVDRESAPICRCDAPKDERKMEYEEAIVPLGGGKVNGLMRNFSVKRPVHGRRIKQMPGHHISVKPPAERFAKGERLIIMQKLVGPARKRFKQYLSGHYVASTSEIARWKKLASGQ